MHGLGEKPESDGKQFLYRANLFAIQQEQDHVVVTFHQHMSMGDQHVLTAYYGADSNSLR